MTGHTERNPLRALALPVYIPSFVYATGAGAIAPVIILAALQIGFTEAQSSAVVGAVGLIGVFASPPLGRMITRIGDRAALITAGVVAGTALLIAISAIVAGAAHPGYAKSAFILSLTFISIGSSVWHLGRQAYLAEAVAPAWRARGLSTLGGMSRLGDLVGPAISTALVAVWFLGSAFWLAFACTLLATAMVVVFLVPPARGATLPDAGPAASGAQPATAVGGAGSVTGGTGVGDINERTIPSPFATAVMGIGLNALTILRANRVVIVPLWGAFLGVDAGVITATFAASALLDSVMFIVSGGLMDRHGRLAAILPSLLVMPTGILIMLLWQGVPGFVVGAMVLGLGNGFGAGVVMTTGADLSPSRKRADFLGIWAAIVKTGAAAGPFVAAGMTALVGVAGSLWATAGIGLAGAVWLTFLITPAYRRLGIDLKGRPLA